MSNLSRQAHKAEPKRIAAGAASPASDASPVAFAMPAGWTRSLADDGDVFFVNGAGEALWMLFVRLREQDGRSTFFNCADGAQWPERPPIADGDAAAAVVGPDGERLSVADA